MVVETLPGDVMFASGLGADWGERYGTRVSVVNQTDEVCQSQQPPLSRKNLHEKAGGIEKANEKETQQPRKGIYLYM